MTNNLENVKFKKDLIKKTEDRLEIIAATMHIDRKELLQWAIIDSALSSIWSIQDNGKWWIQTSKYGLVFMSMAKAK